MKFSLFFFVIFSFCLNNLFAQTNEDIEAAKTKIAEYIEVTNSCKSPKITYINKRKTIVEGYTPDTMHFVKRIKMYKSGMRRDEIFITNRLGAHVMHSLIFNNKVHYISFFYRNTKSQVIHIQIIDNHVSAKFY